MPEFGEREMKSRLFSTFALLFFLHLFIFAQRTNQVYWAYIDQYKGIAIEQMQKYRIPASITLAQGLLESAAGRSSLVTKANNHFGIKVSGNWTGPYVLKNDDAPNEKFRKYRNARESYEDHSRFLQGKRYQSLFRLKITDYRGWARGLKAAGYATSPTYAESLIRIIEMYDLYKFDNGSYRAERKTTPVIPVTNAKNAFFQTHTLYTHNKNYFIIVEVGDNMATISKETGVSLRKLYKYNDLPRDYAPTQGDLIYLKKKQKCASKQFKKNPIHIVEQNQSLFDISQLYGIRLKNLYKMNQFDPSHEIKPGDIIRIR